MAAIPSGIVSAVLEDRLSGESFRLSTREGSGCHFTEKLSHGGFDIAFRVDWTDSDESGDPCLDADFFEPGGTNPVRRMKERPAHHTRKARNDSNGEWAYEFEHEGLHLRFVLRLTRQSTITGNSTLVAPDSP
jgi:hypothetical protein